MESYLKTQTPESINGQVMDIPMQTLRKEIESRVIEESDDVGIRITDQKEDLICFCSDNPETNKQQEIEDDDELITPQLMDDFELSIKGYVFSNDELVFKSKSYPKKYNKNTRDEIKDIENCNAYIMKEGTCIRVFYHRDKWFITTNRKLNAMNSRWGNEESFGELFVRMIEGKTGKSIDSFLETLDKTNKYAFLIGTSRVTRIVAPKYDDVTLLYVLNSQFESIQYKPLKNWYAKKITANNFDELEEFVDNLKFPFSEGYGLYIEYGNSAYKLQNKEYKEWASLRNNLPSIMFAYLNVWADDEKRTKFRYLYSDFVEEFDKYDQEIKAIANDLCNKYFKRFVKKEKLELNKHEHHILYQVHGIFLKNKIPIKQCHVIEAMKTVPATNINKIIGERKMAAKFSQLEKTQ